MKHGISTEVRAKIKYLSVMRKQRHVRLSSIDPGMTVMREHPFISSSPDLDVSCDCCGDGLAEFKCLASGKDQIPTAENLSYLKIREGETKLQKNSDYYFQVQGQMGVTGKKYTDFFVLKFKGWHKERIYFDPKFLSDVLKTLAWFWYKYVGPELITHELKNHLEKKVLSEKDTDVAPSSVTKSPKRSVKCACVI